MNKRLRRAIFGRLIVYLANIMSAILVMLSLVLIFSEPKDPSWSLMFIKGISGMFAMMLASKCMLSKQTKRFLLGVHRGGIIEKR